MYDFFSPIIIAQFLAFLLTIPAFYIAYRRSKYDFIIIFFVFIIATIFGKYKLDVIILYLNNTFSIVNSLLVSLKAFEPVLISNIEGLVSWVSVVLGSIVTWCSLIYVLINFTRNNVIRGTQIKMVEEMQRALKKYGKARVPIKIGQYYLPIKLEDRSHLTIGEPGSGKTQLSNSIQQSTLVRRERSINVDVNGETFKKLGKENDLVLSVNYQEGIATSPFSEILTSNDCEMIANAFIPEGQGESKAWNGYARSLLSIIIRWCWDHEKTQNKDLIYFIKQASIEELDKMTRGTFAQRLFEKGSEKMLSNVLSILSQHMGCLELLHPAADKNSFSLRKWISNDSNNNLWIIYDEFSTAATLSLRTAWIEILIREALNLEPDSKRRLWFFLDELASNGKIESLSQAVSRGRKYGLILNLCLQSLSQLYHLYGRDEATSILGSVGHYVVLRTPDPDTSDYLSRAIGEKEIQRDQVSYSKTGSNTQRIIETKRSVLPSEIAALSDLNGYIKFAGIGWAKIKIPLIKLKDINSLTPVNVDKSSPDKTVNTGIAIKSKLTFDEI